MISSCGYASFGRSLTVEKDRWICYDICRTAVTSDLISVSDCCGKWDTASLTRRTRGCSLIWWTADTRRTVITTWSSPATATLHSGRKISARTIRSCVLLTASLMMRLSLQLRARASVAAVLRRSPCARPQHPLPTSKRTTPKTYIQAGAGYTIPVWIGDFRPAEIGCFLPAQNGDFLPALTNNIGNLEHKVNKKRKIIVKKV